MMGGIDRDTDMSKKLTDYNDEALALLCLRLAAVKGLSDSALITFGRSICEASDDEGCRIDWVQARRDLEALLQP